MNESKASRYQRLRRRTDAAAWGAGALALLALAFTPASRAAAGWAHAAAAWLPQALQGFGALIVFVALIVLCWEVVALPAALYFWLRIDRKFRDTGDTMRSVLIAQAQGAMVALPGACVVAMIVIASVSAVGASWWLWAGVGLAVARAAALRVVPAVLSIVGRARAIENLALAADLTELARRAGVPIVGLKQWRAQDPARASAIVTGAGRGRRVLLGAEMLREWPADEIGVVVAHELAHHAYHDLWRTLALDSVVFAGACYVAASALAACGPALGFSGAADLAALPFLALAAGAVWLAATPIRHAQSRAHERRADAFALGLVGGSSADAFGAALRRLGAQHLAEERPSALTRWLFHRHPSIAERLEFARGYRGDRE